MSILLQAQNSNESQAHMINSAEVERSDVLLWYTMGEKLNQTQSNFQTLP